MRAAEDVGAFCEHGRRELRTSHKGLLAGLTFGVKDLFDVAGIATGAGSPEWMRTHPMPTTSAPAVACLLDAGAIFVGKTRTDELAWSLSGQNAHYGTPVNVAAPGRIPGGSSSGSAAATAAGLVDFALGSDTGGSVRLPASFCGLYGMRPTHGRISIAGAVPLAPSYDTVGWFARDAEVFGRVGRVLSQPPTRALQPSRLIIAEDLFGLAGPGVREALAPGMRRLEALLGRAEEVDVAQGNIAAWRDAFSTIQSAEAWVAHGTWIERVRPALGPGVRERFGWAALVEADQVLAARVLRASIRGRLDRLVAPGTVMALPTANCIAPRLEASDAEMGSFRAGALALSCLAGHAGLPQISLPLGGLDGCPLGLSLIAARDEDDALLDIALALGSPGAAQKRDLLQPAT